MFIKGLIRKLYREEADGLGGDSGGGYVMPEAFASDAEKAELQKGLDAMDDEFGGDDGEVGTDDPGEGGEKKPEVAPAAPKVEEPGIPLELAEGAPNTYKSSTGKIVSTMKAPSGWSPEDAVGFDALAEPVRKAIHAREDQFHVGLENFKQGHAFAERVSSAVQPYMADIQAANTTPDQAIAYLFDVNNRLIHGTPEVKLATVKFLLQSTGVTPAMLGAGEEANPDYQAPYVDPEVARLRAEVDRINLQEQTRAQDSQRAMRQKAEQELDSFLAATPGASELMNDMLPFLRNGLSLQQAHEKATWLNPTTRQAKIDAETKSRADAATKEAAEKAEAAAKASGVNVRSSARKGSPTAPEGSIDDTMREVYAKMNS
jgi:hypothetical protein